MDLQVHCNTTHESSPMMSKFLLIISSCSVCDAIYDVESGCSGISSTFNEAPWERQGTRRTREGPMPNKGPKQGKSKKRKR